MTWPLTRLGDVSEIVSGSTPKTGVPEYWNGEIPWVTPADLSKLESHFITDTPRKLTSSGLRNSGARMLPIGSVLFSSRAPIGHVAITSVPMSTNQGFKSFVPEAGRVDSKYLFWWLRANKTYLQSLGVGATFKEVSKSIVSDVRLPLPSIAEQRRIAVILDQTDALRTQRRRALALLDELVDAMFAEMLRKRKNSGTASLGSYCSKITDGTHQSPEWTNAGVPFLFVSNIVGGTVNYLTSKYVSEETYLELTRNTPVEVGDVLYSAVGSYGVPALVTEDRQFIFQRHIAHIKPRHDRIDSSFLRAALASPTVKRQADRVARGAAQKTVTLGELAKFEIPVVPLESQKEFANRLSKLTLLRSRGVAHLDQLDHLFSSLQHRAFSGEL